MDGISSTPLDLRRKHGFVLVFTLILLALATGPAYMALAYARVALAEAERQKTAALMRIEAADAVWMELQRLAGVAPVPDAQVSVKTTPAGFKTRMNTRQLTGQSVPASLTKIAQIGTGDACYLVIADVTATDRQTSLQTYIARGSNGVVRILAWLEP